MIATKSSDIGLRRAWVLSGLSQAKQFDLIAQGLPVLMTSAQTLLLASHSLIGHGRAAAILEGHAMEEAAKILILVDIVRCPDQDRSSRLGKMIRWFYSHLARSIYIDAQKWRPTDVNQLQEYVDNERKSHCVDGPAEEWIMPNWTTYSRESRLYADIGMSEEGEIYWNEPVSEEPIFDATVPIALRTCMTLRDIGGFSRKGLQIMSDIWGQIDFKASKSQADAEQLTFEMLDLFRVANLNSAEISDSDIAQLRRFWQMPMYRIDFGRIDVPLDDLKLERDANRWWRDVKFPREF